MQLCPAWGIPRPPAGPPAEIAWRRAPGLHTGGSNGRFRSVGARLYHRQMHFPFSQRERARRAAIDAHHRYETEQRRRAARGKTRLEYFGFIVNAALEALDEQAWPAGRMHLMTTRDQPIPCELCAKPAGAKLELQAMLDFEDDTSEEWPELFELVVCEECARRPDIVRTLLRLAADAADAAGEGDEPNGS